MLLDIDSSLRGGSSKTQQPEESGKFERPSANRQAIHFD